MRLGLSAKTWAASAALVATVGCMEEPLVVDYAAEQKEPPPAYELPDRLPEVIIDEDGYATLSGQVKNWLTNAYVDGVEVTAVGIVPEPVPGTAPPGQGGYALEQVQVAGVFWAKAYKTGYVSTYEYVKMPQGDYPNKTLYILGEQDLQALATAYGKTPNPACGTVVAEVKNLANQGQANLKYVALTGVDYEGPYFLNEGGLPDPTKTATTASGRVVFFNVCSPGVTAVNPNTTARLTVEDQNYTVTTPVYLNIYANAATRGVVQVAAGNDPLPQTPEPLPPDELIDFTTHVYPIIVKEGCAACHAVGGAAAVTGLYMTGTPYEVYNALKNDPIRGPVRVNLEYPAQSYVLTKPLYEEPPNHPNAAFPSTDYPDYLTILHWIQQGAPYGDEPQQPVNPGNNDFPPNVDFATQVYPLFAQRTCTSCHNAALLSGGMNLTGTPYEVYQRLMEPGENRVVPGDYAASYLYTKPNAGYLQVVHEGGKPVAGADDPFARYVGGWIYQGAPAPNP